MSVRRLAVLRRCACRGVRCRCSSLLFLLRRRARKSEIRQVRSFEDRVSDEEIRKKTRACRGVR